MLTSPYLVGSLYYSSILVYILISPVCFNYFPDLVPIIINWLF